MNFSDDFTSVWVMLTLFEGHLSQDLRMSEAVLGSLRRTKKIILRFVDYFALLINEFGCGYARFEAAAVQTFSEQQRNQKKVENFCQNLNFCQKFRKFPVDFRIFPKFVRL